MSYNDPLADTIPVSQVLLDIAPSYFRHMESTSSRPSALAKLLGFYTVEIKNLESGSIQAKADLLVMENLFYNRNVTKTFDLKGIQGRKCKGPGANLSKSSAGEGKEGEKESAGKVGQRGKRTLFDGDWIEGEVLACHLMGLWFKVNIRSTEIPNPGSTALKTCLE